MDRMNNRRQAIVKIAIGVLAPWRAFAQPQAAKMPRIGFLAPTSAPAFESFVQELRRGLRDLGYVEGKNIRIEFRWAEGKYERLPALAAELVGLQVDVIVA